MPSALLPFLLLIGGYVFNHLLHPLRFRAQTLDGYRLVFEAGLTGCIFLLPARWMVQQLKPLLVDWLSKWYAMTADTAFVGTTVLAFAMAPAAATAGNMLLGAYARRRLRVPSRLYAHHRQPIRFCVHCWKASREFSLAFAVDLSGNALQHIFYEAATRAREGFTVGLTLSNRRIYAALVTRAPNLSPADSQYVRLIPLMSGYRTEDRMEVTYDYAYPPTSKGLMTVAVSEIVSAHLLSPGDFRDIRERMRRRHGEAGSEGKGVEEIR